MAMSPGSRRRDNRTADDPQDPASLNPMQEPLGSMDRPIPRTSDDNDLNISSNGTGRTAGNLGRTGTVDNRRGSGFMTTFAVIAAILVAAFLIALYVNSDRTNVATTPSTTGDTTGSTTPATPPATTPDTAPATGNTDTGTGTGTGSGAGGGTAAPANP